MAVARDDLGGDGLRRQPERARDMRLDARIDIGEGADGAGDGAGRDLVARAFQPRRARAELGIGEGQLQPEGGRLGMDAVRAADGRRELVLEGAALQRRLSSASTSASRRSAARVELHAEAGVEHVGGGQPQVNEARLRADDLGKVRQEGDDVVLDLALDGVDARHVETGVAALLPDLGRGFLGSQAELGHGVERMRLDLEPDAELRFGRPDVGHLRAAVARNHPVLRS